MDLELLIIIINASLFTLIWLVQLVIYPGFLYYNETDIKRWHTTYSRRISLFVMPLMVGQLLVYGFATISDPAIDLLVILGLILVNWLITFFGAVPLHNAIAQYKTTTAERRKLVNINWIRTINWTVILILSLVYYGK